MLKLKTLKEGERPLKVMIMLIFRLQKLTTWYGTANLIDSLSMSFMLDIEDKIKDRIWFFEKQATSSTVAVEVPGINCLAMYAPHAQSGNLRVECQRDTSFI